MKLFASTIEKMAWLLVVILFVIFSVAAFYAIRNYHAIKAQDQIFHAQNVENQKIIVTDVKDYIACLLTINPQSSVSLSIQEQTCFDKAPEVK